MNSCAACGVTPMSFASVNARLAVEQRVVDHLRGAAQLVRVAAAVGAEHLQRRLLVDVGALAERVDEHRRPRPGARARGTRSASSRPRSARGPASAMNARADLAAELGADRDVLQVRIAAAQAAGRRDRLVEAGVHAAGLGIDQLRQRVDVGALQLLQRRATRESAAAGRAPAPAPRALRRRSTARRVLPVRFSAGSCSLSKRISDELLRRVDVELARRPARRSASSAAPARARRCCDCAASAGPSMRTPARSTATSTGISGRSRSRRPRRAASFASSVAERSARAARRGRRARRRSRAPPRPAASASDTAFAPRPQTSSSVSAL